MRKTGKAKTLLTMLLAAAALQAGTAFGAQATGESQLQAGTWGERSRRMEIQKAIRERWQQAGSRLQAAGITCSQTSGLAATGMLRMNDRTYYFKCKSR